MSWDAHPSSHLYSPCAHAGQYEDEETLSTMWLAHSDEAKKQRKWVNQGRGVGAEGGGHKRRRSEGDFRVSPEVVSCHGAGILRKTGFGWLVG